MKELFEKWLINNTKSSNETIKKWVRYINSVSKDMMDENIIKNDIYSISSYGEFVIIYNKIINNDYFIAKNSRGHRWYSGALNQYLLFLKSLNI